MYRTLSAPLAVQVEITDNCNQLCSHCYRACQNVKKTETTHLTPEQAIKIVEELSRCGVMSLCFTGGEPLMYKETVKAGVQKARELGLTIYCNSNLQVLDDEMPQFFKKYKVGVLTSLFSHEASIHDKIAQRKGLHDGLLRNIKLLADAGILISANMVVRKENAHQVYETGKLAYNLGVKRFSATKVAPSPNTEYYKYRATPNQIKNSLDYLIALRDEFGMRVDILESYPLCFFRDCEKYSHFARRNCTAAVLNCTVSPNGDIRPCSHADMTYGNILKEGLIYCWKSMQEWRDGSLLNKICQNCEYLNQCSGGCRIDAKIHYGDIRGRDPLMSSPNRVEKPLKNADQNNFSNIILPDEVEMYKFAKIRKEDFGGLIILNYDLVFLSKMGYSFLKKNQGKKLDVKKTIINGLTESEKYNFLAFLYSKKIMRDVKECHTDDNDTFTLSSL
ncbi:MAG: radical SAM protein [bacterium]|nr:radical SAM protein [bacterium]